MQNDILQVKFENRVDPKSNFDIVKLEELYQRKMMQHDIEDFHKVDFFILLFITEGKGKHTIDFTDYSIEKGTILTIRKHQIQKFSRSSSIKGFILMFMEEFVVSHLNELEALKSLQLFNELLSNPKIGLSETAFSDFISLIKHIEYEYFHSKDEFSLGIIRSTMHILITYLFRIKSKNEQVLIEKKYLPQFTAFQALVEENCFKTKKVKDYAHKLGISTRTLNTIVNSIVNQSAKTLIDEIVITQIKRLLINSNLSVKEIAFTAGFDEPSNLFRFFKKYTQVSPEAFRKGHFV